MIKLLVYIAACIPAAVIFHMLGYTVHWPSLFYVMALDFSIFVARLCYGR